MSLLPKQARFPLALGALMVAHHAAIWVFEAAKRGVPVSQVINHWDAGHYTFIIQRGYQGLSWAFFPLYPLTLRGLYRLGGFTFHPVWLGTVFSTCCFFVFIWACSRLAERKEGPGLLYPETRWGWFLFIYSPASYVFHSQHTESLFLILSLLAFTHAVQGDAIWTGLFSGLSLWTRNQGLLVAFAAGLLCAAHSKAGRLGRFFTVGAVAATFLAAFFVFQASAAGHPFAFMQAQSHWTHARNATEVFKTFFFANPWQSAAGINVVHHLFFFATAGVAIWVWKYSRPAAVYGMSSLAPMPLQAELINAFRFGTVLFPLLFRVGDAVARWPKAARWALAIAWIVLNHVVARRFAIHKWAY